jgi:hypothetical protein
MRGYYLEEFDLRILCWKTSEERFNGLARATPLSVDINDYCSVSLNFSEVVVLANQFGDWLDSASRGWLLRSIAWSA